MSNAFLEKTGAVDIARKHLPPGTPVHVTAKLEGGTFRLAVANEGDTIAPEKLDKLFQPYWRDDDGQPRRGLGLGLYIASEIAHAHGGTLSAVSQDRHTEFTFSAPAGLR